MRRLPPNSGRGCSWVAALILLVLIAAFAYYGVVHKGTLPEDPQPAFPDRLSDPGPSPGPVQQQ